MLRIEERTSPIKFYHEITRITFLELLIFLTKNFRVIMTVCNYNNTWIKEDKLK